MVVSLSSNVQHTIYPIKTSEWHRVWKINSKHGSKLLYEITDIYIYIVTFIYSSWTSWKKLLIPSSLRESWSSINRVCITWLVKKDKGIMQINRLAYQSGSVDKYQKQSTSIEKNSRFRWNYKELYMTKEKKFNEWSKVDRPGLWAWEKSN